MNKELLAKEVLVMYDVRGIQDYIFKTNAAKEIVGASVIVRDIIIEGLRDYIANYIAENDKQYYMLDWQNDDPGAFLKCKEIKIQIMFVGGGNAYVLFRSGAECQKVNRFLGSYILRNTYSLKLAISVVEKTDSYANDYAAINSKMQKIKAEMPLSAPIGAMPFMAVDSITGYPLTVQEKGDYFSTESYLKRKAFSRLKDEAVKKMGEKIFDYMVTEKGDNSMLAVFHIDGNSMGKFIKAKMENISGYQDAVETMRKISLEISGKFRDTVDKMADYMGQLSSQIKVTDHKLYREIIVAGDDITFVCNEKLALPAVKYFLEQLSDSIEGEHQFSACGGIAYFHSHFPFSDAYEVAESCCGSAKNLAKKIAKEVNGEVGNYVDFQICSNVRAVDLDDYREHHYLKGGELFIGRPYCVRDQNHAEKVSQVSELDRWIKFFDKQPRSKMKYLRDAIPGGSVSREEALAFLESRGYTELKDNKEQYKIWYDALELMDWYIESGEEGGQAHEN